MRLFDAEAAIIKDLKEESEVVAEKTVPGLTVITARHPTLGKLVIIAASNGSGVVVEVDE